MSDGQHRVLADGYCETCQQVGCTARAGGRARTTGVDHTAQLNRLETKLNRLLRAAGLEGDD